MFRNRRGILASAAVAMATATVFAMASPARAAGGQTALQRQIDAIVRLNPGSFQISKDSVQLAPNVISTVLSIPDYICQYHYLCMFENIHEGGERLSLGDCQFYNLSNWYMRDGRRWNDRISSMVNNQTKGVYSAVYDWQAHGASGWYFMGHVGPAPATRTDFTIDRDPAGQAWNDRVDGVWVC